jgi:16S rRNA (guanine966-N2)-methyltransferase
VFRQISVVAASVRARNRLVSAGGTSPRDFARPGGFPVEVIAPPPSAFLLIHEKRILSKGPCGDHREDGGMRMSGGRARGISLVTPKGDLTRPATDGMRQAVFSSLGPRVVGAQFLDLFAGSGAYGLEALSRGAAGGTFVEFNAKAVACIRQNILAVCKSMGVPATLLEVLPADARQVPLGKTLTPDLVFIDPPYEVIPEIAPGLFARLLEKLVTKPDALVVFELPGELALQPEGWTMLKRLGKGARQPTAAFFMRTS